MPGLRKEMPWKQRSRRKLYRENNAMTYAGMRAHYSTFQLKGKQEDNADQNRSIIALDLLQLVIPYLSATYLVLLETSEQPKLLGLSSTNGFTPSRPLARVATFSQFVC